MAKHGPLKIVFEDASKPFGTEKNPPKFQPEGDVDQLLDDAKKVEPMLPDIACSIIEKANEDLRTLGMPTIKLRQSYKLGPTKTKERILEKADGEYEGLLAAIRDITRAQLGLKDNRQIAALCTVMEWAAHEHIPLPHGAQIVITSNRFEKPTPTGYSSFKANIAIPMPGEPGRWHVVELMTVNTNFEHAIATTTDNKLKKNSHGVYETERTLEDKARSTELTKESALYYGRVIKMGNELHQKARKEFGLDDIDFKPFINLRHQETEKAWQKKLEEEEGYSYEIIENKGNNYD